QSSRDGRREGERLREDHRGRRSGRAAGRRHAASGLRAAGLVSRVVTIRGVTAGARGGRGLLPELRASGEGRRAVLPELRGEHRWVRPPEGGEDTRVRTGYHVLSQG